MLKLFKLAVRQASGRPIVQELPPPGGFRTIEYNRVPRKAFVPTWVYISVITVVLFDSMTSLSTSIHRAL